MDAIPLYNFSQISETGFPFSIESMENVPKDILINRPRRHDFYMVLWLTSGAGTHFVDFNEYPIRPNGMYFVAPGQVQYWEVQAPLKGICLGFEESLFHLYHNDRFFSQLDLFSILKANKAIYCNAADATLVSQIAEQLMTESRQEKFGRAEAIASLLQYLLVFAQRQLNSEPGISARGIRDQLAHQFLHLLEEQAMTEHSLDNYASRLGVTIGHLTETVKAVTGFSAGVLLRNRVVLEAHRWLAHSDLSVGQISSQLNFNDPSYFGRFIKRETGFTPRAFRDQFRTKYQNAHR